MDERIMIGTQAERFTLGAILLDPTVYRFAAAVCSGDDFTDGRLGAIFAGIGRMQMANEYVDVITVAAKFPDWLIRGYDSADLFVMQGEVGFAYAVGEYAQQVRDDSLRRGLRNVGRVLLEETADEGQAAPDTLARARTRLADLEAGVTSGDFIAKKLAEIVEGVADYDWAIPGLLERKDRLIMTGGEGSGKTTFVRQLAILSAAGIHPIDFTPIEPVKVLVVDVENTEQQWHRASSQLVKKAALQGAADPGQTVHLFCSSRINITKDAHLGAVHRLIDVHQPDILFIGPLYKMVPGAITNDDDAAPLIVALDSLRDRNVALVMEAHAGKGAGMDGARDLRPRGSAALVGWPEFGLGIAGTASESAFHLKRWRGMRERRDWPATIQRGGEWPWMRG